MDFHGQKANLSFSIENILRDDFSFSHHRRQTNVVSLQTRESSFDPWPNTPVYRCYAVRSVHCSPVFMRYLPTTQRIGARLCRANREKERFLPMTEPAKTTDDECLSCKDEAIQEENGKISFQLNNTIKLKLIKSLTSLDIFALYNTVLLEQNPLPSG